MSEGRPQDCVSRILYATLGGAGSGAILGAITANWSDVPRVIRNKSWPAFKQTGPLRMLLNPCTTLLLCQLCGYESCY